MISLSHSALGKFSHCPVMYKLHYLDKIRPTGTTSALLFGSALDKACESYLLNGNTELARSMFHNTWNEQEIDGVLTELNTCLKIEYHSTNDFDHELLVQSDNESILKDTSFISVSDLVSVLSDPDLATSEEEKARLAYAKWISLYRKGKLMLSAFISWVDENVEEVLGAQIPIELEDEDGNKVTGFADFVIKVKGYDKPIVVDLKTAARPYMRDSVLESEQLALYFLYLREAKFSDMERAAYLVLSKQIKKNRTKTCRTCNTVTTGREKTCAEGGKGKGRCNGEFDEVIDPECSVQYIHDEPQEQLISNTLDKFNNAVVSINAGVFEKNLEGCAKYYGRECPYKKYCETGCMDGLIKKESSERKAN